MGQKQDKKNGKSNGKANGADLSGAREYLKMVAIVVEAAGSFDRALKLGLIAGGAAVGIRGVIPRSLGGLSEDPAAEDKWLALLIKALDERGEAALAEAKATVELMERVHEAPSELEAVGSA